MSRRNFILLIIILVIAVITTLGFLYFRGAPTDTTEGDTGGTNFFSQFNPFGASPTTPPPVTPPVDISGTGPDTGEIADVKLRKISSMAVAGYGVYQKERVKETTPPSLPLSGEENSAPPAKGGSGGLKTEFAPAVRYVEKAQGIIYQTFADKIQEQKFSKTVIPKVHDSYFGNRGGSVVMRYLKADDRTIETFVGTLPKEVVGKDSDGSNEIKGAFLPVNIKDVSVSPDSSKIFYLFIAGDNVVGITSDLLTNKKVQVFDSPFTEWNSFWPNSKIITLTTKPSALVPGHMYALDISNKNLNKVLGDINGLTTLTSPNGKLILYGDSNLSMNIYNTGTRVSNALGIRTLPEKCVWGKGNDVVYCAVPKSINLGLYPDSWYQGEMSFSDQLWKINVADGNGTIISDPITVTGGEDVDGVKLSLDEAENYLFFINKKDNFLWELVLK